MRRGRGPAGQAAAGGFGAAEGRPRGALPLALRAPAGMLQKPDEEMPRNFSTTEELRDIIEILFQEGASGNAGKFLPGGICGGAPYPGRKVATYGQIAMLAGSPRASRIVGGALHRNPEPGKTPCHRVVFRDGQPGAGFAFGGTGAQRALLEAEGVTFLPDGRVDMARHQWTGEDETL